MNVGFHEHPVIFFDGVCSLCNGFVDFLIRHDKKEIYYFAPLQGEFAAEIVALTPYRNAMSSVVLWQEGRVYSESTAALKILIGLGGPWRAMKVFFLVPGFIRDAVYRFISRHRYRFFGKRETCRLPTPEEKARFL